MSNHNYILSKRVARGGMAEIFLGKVVGSDDFQRIVAIKRILPHYAQENEYIEMFRAEASICKRLQHANIVQVYDFNRVDDSYAIIMEFVDGNDLRSLLAACEKSRVRLTIPMAVYIAAQAARGLHYAHTRIDEVTRKPLEIVHRDISPQNLLISYEGEVKVIDFGIAKFEAKTQETKPGVVKGKYSYMSPEQVTAKPLDARTDVFSLSIVLWEILAMKRLFAGETEVETIKNVQNGMIKKPLRDFNKQVDERLSKIISKGLSRDRRKRYQSASEFEKDLLKYLNSRFPDFTASDLGNFVRQIFAKKRSETQKVIQKLLSETSKPNEPQPSAEGRGSSVSQPENTGTHTRTDASYQADPHDKRIELNLNDVANRSTPALPLATGNNRRVVIDVTQPPPVNRTARPQSGAPRSQSRSHTSGGRGTSTGQQRGSRANRPQQSQARRGHRQTQRRSSSTPIVVLGTFVAVAIISFGLMIHRQSKPALGSMQLNIDTRPNRIVLRVDGKIQEEGRYISTPTKIKLPSGNHKIEVMRHGYLPQKIQINGKPGEVYATQPVILQRNPKKRFVRMQLRTKPKQKVAVDIDNGWFRGSAPRVLNGVTIGDRHKIEIYPNHPTRKGAFKCSFTPEEGSRVYVLEIQINSKGPSRCVNRN